MEAEKINQASIKFNELDKSDWKSFRFDEIAKNITERVDPNKTDLEVYIGLEHIDSESLHIKRFGTPDDVDGQKLKFYKGDVIFGRRRAYQRKAGIATSDGFCSAHALVLRANPEVINPALFPFFLHSDLFMNRAIDISVGSLSPTINWGTLKHQKFKIPPLEMQGALSEVLWSNDHVIQTSLRLAECLKKTQYQVIENIIYESSSETKKYTFGSIGEWKSGGTPSKKNAKFWDGGDILWVTPKDMKSLVLSSSMDRVTEKAVEEGGAKLFRKGSTVLVWRSGILQHTLPIARVDDDFTINQDLKCFIPTSKDFLEDYVRIFLLTFSEKIRRKCVKEGTTVQSINSSAFMDYAIKHIPVEDQHKVIKIEANFDEAREAAQNKHDESKKLLSAILQEAF